MPFEWVWWRWIMSHFVRTYVYFTFIRQEYVDWVWKSRLAVTFLQFFNDVIPLSSHFPCFFVVSGLIITPLKVRIFSPTIKSRNFARCLWFSAVLSMMYLILGCKSLFCIRYVLEFFDWCFWQFIHSLGYFSVIEFVCFLLTTSVFFIYSSSLLNFFNLVFSIQKQNKHSYYNGYILSLQF